MNAAAGEDVMSRMVTLTFSDSAHLTRAPRLNHKGIKVEDKSSKEVFVEPTKKRSCLEKVFLRANERKHGKGSITFDMWTKLRFRIWIHRSDTSFGPAAFGSGVRSFLETGFQFVSDFYTKPGVIMEKLDEFKRAELAERAPNCDHGFVNEVYGWYALKSMLQNGITVEVRDPEEPDDTSPKAWKLCQMFGIFHRISHDDGLNPDWSSESYTEGYGDGKFRKLGAIRDHAQTVPINQNTKVNPFNENTKVIVKTKGEYFEADVVKYLEKQEKYEVKFEHFISGTKRQYIETVPASSVLRYHPYGAMLTAIRLTAFKYQQINYYTYAVLLIGLILASCFLAQLHALLTATDKGEKQKMSSENSRLLFANLALAMLLVLISVVMLHFSKTSQRLLSDMTMILPREGARQQNPFKRW